MNQKGRQVGTCSHAAVQRLRPDIIADRGPHFTTKQEAATIELKSTVAQQQKAMEILTAQLQEQAAQIQRVSAQLAAASPSRGGLELNKFAKNP